MYSPVFIPFVLTVMASGFGFAQGRWRLGEGYPRSSPTWQAGWELEESRETKQRRVESYAGGGGGGGEGGNEVRERALGEGGLS